jgi:hypothetical protein
VGGRSRIRLWIFSGLILFQDALLLVFDFLPFIVKEFVRLVEEQLNFELIRFVKRVPNLLGNLPRLVFELDLDGVTQQPQTRYRKEGGTSPPAFPSLLMAKSMA